jgi:hypothetical protein
VSQSTVIVSENGIPASMDDEEVAAMSEINSFTARIYDWGLCTNKSELIAATHVLEGFVIQHMLHRVQPNQWSDWYSAGDDCDE